MVDDAWVEVHLSWVLGLFPRTMTAVDDGGNHFTTNVLLIFDPLVKANLKWQLECPALLITTPAILWVAIENLGNYVKIPFQKVFFITTKTICYVSLRKVSFIVVMRKFCKKIFSQVFLFNLFFTLYFLQRIDNWNLKFRLQNEGQLIE